MAETAGGAAHSMSRALAGACSAGIDRLDAQLLLLNALDKSAAERAWLVAHDQDALPAVAAERFASLCKRRALGEPLAYLVGRQEFFGLSLAVDARVLIPRPDTETLVNWALEALQPPLPTAARVLDLGTGSGAIALAIKQARPAWQVSAIDASADAVAVAQNNAQALGLDVPVALSRWLDSVCGEFELMVSNPPYVREGDPHLAALGHEPAGALTAGADGLDDLRQIIDAAPGNLASGGWLLMEHGWDQAAAVGALLRARGFKAVESRPDLAGILRCTGGRWPDTGRGTESAG